jgi:hypothetical protein
MHLKEERKKAIARQPPSTSQTPCWSINRRWRVNADISRTTPTTITWRNLFDTLIAGNSATTARTVCSEIKLRRVRIWIPAAAAAPLSSVGYFFEWEGTVIAGSSIATRSTKLTIDCVGSLPGFLETKPPRNSAQSFWHQGTTDSTDNIFTLSIPAGSVIELALTCVMVDEGGVAPQNALVGATAGIIYARGLDGLATASTNFPPEGWEGFQQ